MFWFFTSVSGAEFILGITASTLGITRGLAACLLGHLLGGVFLYAFGKIALKNNMSVRDMAEISLGKLGLGGFGVSLALQLQGWAGIMLILAATMINRILMSFFTNVRTYDRLCVAALCVVLVFFQINPKVTKKFENAANMLLLGVFLYTIYLVAANRPETGAAVSAMPFHAAVEIALTMSVVWCLFMSRYIKEQALEIAKSESEIKAFNGRRVLSTATLAYCAGGVLAFGAGVFAGVYGGNLDNFDYAKVVGSTSGIVGLSVAAFNLLFRAAAKTNMATELFSVAFSKQNSKFIYAFSSGGVILVAFFFSKNLLHLYPYLTNAIVIPLFAVLISDFFILDKKTLDETVPAPLLRVQIVIVWLFGFLMYRVFAEIHAPIGYAVPAFALTALFNVALVKVRLPKKKAAEKINL